MGALHLNACSAHYSYSMIQHCTIHECTAIAEGTVRTVCSLSERFWWSVGAGATSSRIAVSLREEGLAGILLLLGVGPGTPSTVEEQVHTKNMC